MIGGRDLWGSYIPLEGNVYLVYKMYISGMYCQLDDYILPSTLYKNLKNPLNLEWDPLPPKMSLRRVTDNWEENTSRNWNLGLMNIICIYTIYLFTWLGIDFYGKNRRPFS